MEIQQLRQFLAVAETGSFTKGAERAAVSQPALSSAVAKLEEELQVKLFERDKRRVVLTAAGVRLVETAKGVIQSCNKVKAELRDLECKESLRVGVIDTLAIEGVSGLIESFKSNFPQVRLDAMDGSQSDIEDLLSKGRIDLALSIIRDGSANKDAIDHRELFTEPYSLMVPTNHRLGGRQSVRLAELDNEPLIVRNHCEGRRATARILEEANIRPKVVYRTNQDDRALALVASGLGIAFLPGNFRAPGVSQIPIIDFDLHRKIGLFWYRSRDTEAVKRFVRFASTHDWTGKKKVSTTLPNRRMEAVG